MQSDTLDGSTNSLSDDPPISASNFLEQQRGLSSSDSFDPNSDYLETASQQRKGKYLSVTWWNG
jgi:hypothetical protein